MKRPKDMTREELEAEVVWMRSSLDLLNMSNVRGELGVAFNIPAQQVDLLTRLYAGQGQWIDSMRLDHRIRRKDSKRTIDPDKPAGLCNVIVHRLRKALPPGSIENHPMGAYRLTPIGIDAVKEYL